MKSIGSKATFISFTGEVVEVEIVRANLCDGSKPLDTLEGAVSIYRTVDGDRGNRGAVCLSPPTLALIYGWVYEQPFVSWYVTETAPNHYVIKTSM